MGQSKSGNVCRLGWMTLVPIGQNLFKLVSNNGTDVEQVHGSGAENVRDAVQDTLVSMSPQFGFNRSEKMKLSVSRVSLSFVSHMQVADISQDNSKAYKGAVIVPCCFLKELRSLGDSDSGLPYSTAALSARKPLRATVHALATAQ